MTDRLRRAAQNLSDRRTLMDDGFWVSQKEMRALGAALEAAPVADETCVRSESGLLCETHGRALWPSLAIRCNGWAAPVADRDRIEKALDRLIEEYGDDYLGKISRPNLAEWIAELAAPVADEAGLDVGRLAKAFRNVVAIIPEVTPIEWSGVTREYAALTPVPPEEQAGPDLRMLVHELIAAQDAETGDGNADGERILAAVAALRAALSPEPPEGQDPASDASPERDDGYVRADVEAGR